uniref:Uncharacterized protein n=1 Tax=Oryza brachyantha TaxID=4533 RepID=J3N395_ORYBR
MRKEDVGGWMLTGEDEGRQRPCSREIGAGGGRRSPSWAAARESAESGSSGRRRRGAPGSIDVRETAVSP